MNTRRVCATLVFVWLGIIAMGYANAQEVTLTKAVICREIVDRGPVGVGEVFPAGTERVFCYTMIDGAQGETSITHNWYHEGSLKASVVLPVRGPSWRTWSSKTLRPEWTGEWMVEVLGKDGAPLESIRFAIQ